MAIASRWPFAIPLRFQASGPEAVGKPSLLGMTVGGTNGDLIPARPEAKKGLEQGRRVFEREFGISLPKE